MQPCTKLAACRVSSRLRPVFVWRPEVWELGEQVVVWTHPVLHHLPVREDGDIGIAHIVGEQATVVRISNRTLGVVSHDVRQQGLRHPLGVLRRVPTYL